MKRDSAADRPADPTQWEKVQAAGMQETEAIMGIRIEGNSNRRPSPRTGGVEGGTGIGQVRQAGSSGFNSSLSHSFQHAQEERLQQMALEIEAQGKKLSDRIDVGELKAYKRLVADFLEEAVAGSGKFSKESFLDRRGRHRVYATVKTINEKLEAITHEVLKAVK